MFTMDPTPERGRPPLEGHIKVYTVGEICYRAHPGGAAWRAEGHPSLPGVANRSLRAQVFCGVVPGYIRWPIGVLPGP
jgi:hypothetical protein